MTVPPSPRSVQQSAQGKVNLGLRVLRRRNDGYHDLDTIFARLSVHDVLTVTVDGHGVHGETIDGRTGWSSEALPAMTPSNLAWRAADAWLQAARSLGSPIEGVHLHLLKRIPIAAGLGGGSSDAAAVLRALDRLDPGRIDPLALANLLGSDVPFFTQDAAAARGQGRGECLTPLELAPRPIVLVNPGVGVPVAEAYRALARFADPLDVVRFQQAWNAGEEVVLDNSLEPGVLAGWPAVRTTIAWLREAELSTPILSGSGATCFGLAASTEAAERAAAWLRDRMPEAWIEAAAVPSMETAAKLPSG